MEQHEILLIGGLLTGLVAIVPPGFHYLQAKRVSDTMKRPDTPFPMPAVTVLIPARDESFLIEDKLKEILSQDFPNDRIRILVVDSGSIDGTANIAEEFLVEHAGEMPWKVITLERPGKSIAVNHALGMIETDFFFMTDVDSILEPDALYSMMEWFQDDKIGAVCGRYSITGNSPLPAFRRRFNTLRLGESSIDSTPIFEGSVCAFRIDSISPLEIFPDVNADDSQLAIMSRRNGYRAIMDGNVQFTEQILPSEGHSRRSLRRAQGIVRTLFRNRDLVLSREKYGWIYLQNLYFYLFMPWFVLLGLILIFSSLLSFLIQSSVVGHEIYLYSTVLLCAFSFTRTARDFIFGIACLLGAQVLLIFGVRLDNWNPHRSNFPSDSSELEGSEE